MDPCRIDAEGRGKRRSRRRFPTDFGGKSKVAPEVWDAFGDVRNYVEPFAGSLAVLFGRPHPGKIETICDRDVYVGNFWRSVSPIGDPDAVARFADWPVSEGDLTARHRWLVRNRERINAEHFDDPFFFDPMVAGWWVWGLSQWLGSGWCRAISAHGAPYGDHQKRPHLSGGGMGVHGLTRRDGLIAWFRAIQDRLRTVRRIECSDWTRVMGNSVILGAEKSTFITGVFLDPPYAGTDDRQADLYSTDCLDVAHDVRAWALANGGNPRLRIALCGYEGPEMPGWREHAWKTSGGYGSQGEGRGKANKHRERIWFSPHCLDPSEEHREQGAREQGSLFA